MKIYYLGNGFDLFHKLPTRYFDFKIYFKNNFSGFYNKFIKMYGLGEMMFDHDGSYYKDSEDDEIIELWKDFENMLGRIDVDFIYNKFDKIQQAKDLTQCEFEGILDYDQGWYEDIYIENMDLYDLYEPLQKAFISWIDFVEKTTFPSLPERQISPFYPILNKNSKFVVFNYTHTLQKLYHIEDNNIFYPHGEAGNKNNYPKFGHGDILPFKENKIIEMYDEDTTYVIDWITNYLFKTEKDVQQYLFETTQFLKDNVMVFDNDKTIINILGCSFNKIDVPYFVRVNEDFPKAKWNISFYDNDDKKRIKNFLKKYGIRNYNLYRL